MMIIMTMTMTMTMMMMMIIIRIQKDSAENIPIGTKSNWKGEIC